MQASLEKYIQIMKKIHSRISAHGYAPCILALLLLLIAGCSGERSNPDDDSVAVPVYEVKGLFFQYDSGNHVISVAHEEIPGVMSAMRMSLRTEQTAMAESLEPGDIISFQLTRRGASWFAENIEILPEETQLVLPEHLRDLLQR
jgi:Cu/Ag efflux protein CusF